MATTPDQLINNLLASIDKAVAGFNESLPGIQKDVFARVVELSGELETTYGRLKPSVKNVKIIGQIKAELEKIIVSKPYMKRLDEFVGAFDTVTDINSRYFSLVNKRFKPGRVFTEVKRQAIDDTLASLTRSGIGNNVTEGIREILRRNVTSGGRFTDFVDQIRTYITDTKSGDGALVKYAKQITTDSLNQYNATYTQLATADLGMEWFQYAGSLIKTSREWCVEMINAKDTCQRYIHRSQFAELVRGRICGRQVPIYAKTGLPYGMIEGTTADTLMVNRGGWSCGHQFYPVSSAVVPQALREQFE